MFIHNDWAPILEREFEKPYMKELFSKLHEQYEIETVYPPKKSVFRAFELTPYSAVKVVILGQDPYHGENQANGLSFSVTETTKIPPSLRNIFTELVSDIKCSYPTSGDLSKWAREGGLLLNSTLTVRSGQPMSHASMGWERFTDHILSCLNEKDAPIVFILWGNHARSKKRLIDQRKHLVLESVHPSPLSAHRGFFGSAPFSKTNEFLVSKGIHPIDWTLTK
ncbi:MULTISPECIES: uracil-DNA glycosylase [unclassified Turicibacter]|uniref:uracil-DNA glycosylase n=1 Tax=unclassified Turicibacter TaxID=2638206 RepID=UPI00137A28A1|nr:MULTISPECIES: uracil-DNA glycosylase [unclassified Turicibacter]MCU7205440.1 uracil-DNA glycosylase [Turicibacter sp. TA25]MCU7208943.1 uracil-DNA glycosylase [Turicibacter sp. 1E2]NCE78951.1 uracil-DNA glycosylase [Turicibacter sp. TS3]